MEEPDFILPLSHPGVVVHGHHITVPPVVSRRAQMLPQLVDLMGHRLLCRGARECPESGQEEIRASILCHRESSEGGLDSAG